MTVLATNRKASHDYFILEKFEAGIALVGTEVKSCRAKGISLQEAYCSIENGELWLLNCNISPYKMGNAFNHEPTRPRKLLVHAKELRKLKQASEVKGMTLIPLNAHLSHGLIKLDIAICKGKNVGDKRESLRQKSDALEARRAIKHP